MKLENQFGEAFRTVRHAQGLTQEDFAQESGRTYISELERGLKQPTLQKIDALAATLSVHPISLIFMAYLKDRNIQSVEELTKTLQSQVKEILSHSNEN